MVPYIECIDIKMHGMDKLKKKKLQYSVDCIGCGTSTQNKYIGNFFQSMTKSE